MDQNTNDLNKFHNAQDAADSWRAANQKNIKDRIGEILSDPKKLKTVIEHGIDDDELEALCEIITTYAHKHSNYKWLVDNNDGHLDAWAESEIADEDY